MRNTNFKLKSENKNIFNWAIIKRSFKTSQAIYWSLFGISILFMAAGFISVNVMADKAVDTSGTWALENFHTFYYQTMGAIILGIMALIIPINLVTKEIENTSLAILLVSNNSRNKVLLNKIYAIILMFGFWFIIQMIIGSAGLSAMGYGESALKFINMNWTYFVGTLFFAIIMVLAGTFFEKKSLVWTVGGVVLVISILFPMLASFLDGFSFGEYISVFAFVQTDYIYDNSALISIGYGVGIVLMIGLTWLSTYTFNRRDLQL